MRKARAFTSNVPTTKEESRYGTTKGWFGIAKEYYEKLLSLWKNADPSIAEVEDARKRLAGLKEN